MGTAKPLLNSACIAIFVLLAISGCASKKFPITEAYNSNSAKIRFTTKLDKAWIDLYPPDDCNNGANVVFDNFINNIIASANGDQPKRVGMIDSPDPALRNSAEYSIMGGQIINIGVGGSMQCLGGRSFYAEAGEQYEVILKPDFNNECLIDINRLSIKDGSPWRTPVRNISGLICKSQN